MDARRFDDLVAGITEGQTSRRGAAKGLVAAAVASIPVLGGGLDGLARPHKQRKHHKKQKPLRCSGDSCDGTGGKPCGGRDDCECYLWSKGGNVCASSRQSSGGKTCKSDKDCGKGHVCVEGGPACCGRGEKFCKEACYK